MPLQTMKFKPGVNRESTTLANEGGWFESDKVRFRSGYPEKIGGWQRDSGTVSATLKPPEGSYWGVARSLYNWNNLSGSNLLGIGTNLKYYIQNTIGGLFNDVTPIRLVSPAADTTFAATNDSNVITVTDVGSNVQVGDFVTFSGADSLGGNITDTILNAEHRVASYISSDSYTIVVSATANASDTGDGGSSTVATYQISGGADVFTIGVGWGSGGWGGVVTGAVSSTLSSSISNSATTISLVNAASFPASGTVMIGTELITYAAKSTNDLTGCVRGYQSTDAVAHAGGSLVESNATFTGWGAAAPAGLGLGIQLRTWSQSAYGQDLIINPRGGALYYWANNANPNLFNRAELLSPSSSGIYQTDAECPEVCNFVLTSDSSRFVLAFGVNDYGSSVQEPMLIRWSNQEDYTTWTPSVTNQAGSFRLTAGSEIVCAQQTRQEVLVLTDTAVYSMQYQGPPFVWGFQPLATNTSIAGPNAAVTVHDITYWMGVDKFYVYNGRVQTLPCELRQFVFDDINLSQQFQICAGINDAFSEVWWFYCSANSDAIDKYVVYNYLENNWYYGNMARTAWIDAPLREVPVAAGYGGQILYHETGNDDGSVNPPAPIEAFIQSSDFDIGEGHNFGFVWRIIPDLTFDGSTTPSPSVDFSVRPRQFPGSNYGPTNNPAVTSVNNYNTQRVYNVQQFTPQVNVRLRGRQMAFKVSSTGLGVAWQLGAPRIDIRPDGKK